MPCASIAMAGCAPMYSNASGGSACFTKAANAFAALVSDDGLALRTYLASREKVPDSKITREALAASEKAVNKAEVAQQRVNESQNEFRLTLKDQASTLMPRTETEGLVRELRALLGIQVESVADLRSRLDIGPSALPALQAQAASDIGRRAGSLDARNLLFLVLGLAIPIVVFILNRLLA